MLGVRDVPAGDGAVDLLVAAQLLLSALALAAALLAVRDGNRLLGGAAAVYQLADILAADLVAFFAASGGWCAFQGHWESKRSG